MNDKELISKALLEIAKQSDTTFLEIAEGDKELIAAAEKIGIVLPSPDFLVMKTVYAEIGIVNLNGVILSKEDVEKALPTLLFKQCNWEHEGKGRICGFTISAKINGNKIETINCLFKSLFPEEIALLKEKIKSKEAAVSFEIYNRNPETGESVVHELADGNISISPIIFHGTGVLLVSPPACPRAKIWKMIGKCEAIDSKKIEDKSFTEDLVYAELAIEEPKCANCSTCTCEKEVKIVEEIKLEEEILDADYDGGEIDEAKKLTTEQRNSLPDSDFALIQHKDGKKIRRFPINDEAHVRNALARLLQAKDITEEEKKSTLEKILKKAKELNMTELLKKYEKAEKLCLDCGNPLPEDYPVDETLCADCKLKKDVKKAEVIIPETKIEEIKVKAEVKLEEVAKTTPEETKVEAEIKPEVVEEVKKEEANVVTETKVETTVTVIDPDKTVVDVKTVETRDVVDDQGNQVEHVEEKSEETQVYTYQQVLEQVAAAKVELEKVLAEKDIEILKLKQELEVAKQPKEIVKASEEETTQADLTVGEVITTGEDETLKKEKQAVNDFIAKKHKK